MEIALHTNVAHLAPELADVLRVFYGEIQYTVNESGAGGLAISLHVTQAGQQWRCTAKAGEEAAEGEAEIPEGRDNREGLLLRKRYEKRLCKQTLYALLKGHTGIHPPWGSLTGIRPTRLVYEAMEKGISPEKAAAEVVDTFDLQSEKGRILARVVEAQLTMAPPDAAQVDVYIGIPFCTTRCTYCSFSSGEIGKGLLVAPYVKALLGEMEAIAHLIARRGLRLRAVYMGGGTPTSLDDDSFAKVLEGMMAWFPGAMEYTVEAGRPDTLTPQKLRAMAEAGIKRISINPQTMNEETLRRIGRRHSRQDVFAAYDMARKAGFHHINMDLIAGLPGEDAAAFGRTLAGARELRPESLTIHTLALKRGSALWEHRELLPTGEETARMVAMGAEAAAEMGLAPYYLYRQKYMSGNQENVGYALPGYGCQYNVDIMEETTHILALGAGGISKRIFGAERRIERAPNVSNIEQYIARVAEMIARKEALWEEDTPEA